MNAQNINQILDALAERFGATGAHLWAVLIRQVYVDAAITSVFAVAVAFVWTRYLQWSAKREKIYTDFLDDPARVLSGVVLVLCTIVAVVSVMIDVGGLLNPEYAALRRILKLLVPR